MKKKHVQNELQGTTKKDLGLPRKSVTVSLDTETVERIEGIRQRLYGDLVAFSTLTECLVKQGVVSWEERAKERAK